MTTVVTDAPTAQAGAMTTEAEARLHLAAVYRLLAHYGMDDTIFTHASARVPGEADTFLINPYGLLFNEITPSSLVKMSYDGELRGPSNYPANMAGYVIHSAVLQARPEVGCAVHTHTRAGVALSCLEEGLLPLNQFALEFYGNVGYHDYEGVALDLDEQARLGRDLAGHPVLILRNHGLLTVGHTPAAAFYLMYYLEQSARVQMDVLATGRPFRLPPDAVARHTAGQFSTSADRTKTGQRLWPAMLRLLDETQPGWRN
ncbi:ribulose-5-phosphate 4-epimerase/fuculose-1-phosphate aldolase [Stella humosa]|uniref:Ribulose-5-phosphate 4-epimerase/fuculose-1-phosphate aldolase n=1 Tax=Stella humosa TaxID=94 RepID=A0A3N1MJG6_9PROT|nr:class II aldolase/adducin family protein [Stella humosa]ROQ03355.1 ribulose-5-phosphate 4-epimerase/fuculose-1-phosphate aldolase [Stella humosa]BBK29642.1 class II aldolase [Stella humosa]